MKYPENIFNRIASLVYNLKYRMRNRVLVDPQTLIVKSLVTAVDDAKEYLNVSTDTFFRYAALWNRREEHLFHTAEQQGAQPFYESWKGDDAHYNICANILNQHADDVNFKAVYNFMSHGDSHKTTIDYGCGTASLSIAFAKEGLIRGKVVLLDVDNDIKKFIEFRIKKHHLDASVSWDNVASFSGRNACDALYCIDVLEHLKNSSAVFTKNIHPLLKMNGLLYLKAPWRGQLSHLDAAADDFYLHGGRDLLSSHYTVVSRLLAMDIACVYKKRKE